MQKNLLKKHEVKKMGILSKFDDIKLSKKIILAFLIVGGVPTLILLASIISITSSHIQEEIQYTNFY